MMSGESNSASEYFTNNFQGSNVDFDALKGKLYECFASFSANNPREIAWQIKAYCLENGIKLKTNQQCSSSRSTHTTSSSASGNGNVTNITINEGLSVCDYLLLYHLIGNKTTIINNAPAGACSAPPQEKKDKSKEGNANGVIFLVALCVITHLAICAIYHEYFKKEAKKSGKSINYLANCQLGLAIFQLAFGLASLVASGVFLDQSEIFFPLLINTFICLGSAYLFYRERNNTLKTEVEPYMELAKLLIDDERQENQRTRPSTGHPSATHSGPSPTYPQSSSHPDAPHYEAPPAYSLYPNTGYTTFSPFVTQHPNPSAPPADNNQSCVGGSGLYPNPNGPMSYADVTKRSGFYRS